VITLTTLFPAWKLFRTLSHCPDDSCDVARGERLLQNVCQAHHLLLHGETIILPRLDYPDNRQVRCRARRFDKADEVQPVGSGRKIDDDQFRSRARGIKKPRNGVGSCGITLDADRAKALLNERKHFRIATQQDCGQGTRHSYFYTNLSLSWSSEKRTTGGNSGLVTNCPGYLWLGSFLILTGLHIKTNLIAYV
jgi:hypothetical protein